MEWADFERAAPDLSREAREAFERTSVAQVGTIRADGSPRISNVQPAVVDGRLYLGMMWMSTKARDLLRDPRLVLRSPVCTNEGDEREVTLRGRAISVTDRETRATFVEAVAATTTWAEPKFHLFAVDIGTCSIVAYGGGRQHVRLWPDRVEYSKAYG
jgi:Pyridoxamine 5'-phosphate oxidase